MSKTGRLFDLGVLGTKEVRSSFVLRGALLIYLTLVIPFAIFFYFFRLEQRLSGVSFVPRPLALNIFADGAALAMTFPKSSPAFNGKNLLEIVNAHSKVGPVPELVVIHYTIKMLKCIEILHTQGKMLVSKLNCFERYTCFH